MCTLGSDQWPLLPWQQGLPSPFHRVENTMIHPDLLEIRTLIFDMDGTLMRSGDLAIHALRGGLKEFYRAKGETAPDWSDDELKGAIGKPAHEFYRDLLDDRYKPEWADLHKIIFRHEQEWMNSHRITFPGTLRTLATLKKRGYRMAIVSNCSSEYLQTALVTQKMDRYFDRTICIGDRPGKNKAELIREVVSELGGKAAVIGDRDYDIRAAKENNLPAVGALYGYGGRDELLGTDTWVEDIRDLMYLFYPLRELATRFAVQIGKRVQLDRPIVVGLSGVHTALTSELAMLLATEIADNKVGINHLRMNRHRVPTSNSKTNHWIEESFPWRRLEDHVLKARQLGKIDTLWPITEGLDKGKNQPYRGRPGSVILVEGPYLFGPHLRESFDYSIHVEANNAAVRREIGHRRHDEADRSVRVGKLTRKQADEHAKMKIAEEQAEWDSQLDRVSKEYANLVQPRDIAEMVVDGNHLPQGILLKGL